MQELINEWKRKGWGVERIKDIDRIIRLIRKYQAEFLSITRTVFDSKLHSKDLWRMVDYRIQRQNEFYRLPQYAKDKVYAYGRGIMDYLKQTEIVYGHLWNSEVISKWDDMPEELKQEVREGRTGKLYHKGTAKVFF